MLPWNTGNMIFIKCNKKIHKNDQDMLLSWIDGYIQHAQHILLKYCVRLLLYDW